MRVCYCGSKQLKTPKSLIINDPIAGPIKLVSNVIHYFKLADVSNCGSLVSFMAIDDHHYMSINSFIRDTVGHYMIKVQQQPIEHNLFETDVELVPDVRVSKIEIHNLEEFIHEISPKSKVF